MKKIYQLVWMFVAMLCVQRAGAQITTVISGGSSAAGSYTTFSDAITALNGSTISGPVTVDVTAGQTETLSGKITLTATGTLANPIVIQKSGAGANPKLISYTGTVATPSVIADGFFVLAGSDYVTIDGLDLEESAANTTATTVMEFGYGLFKMSVTDGCQYNTIKNCTITLNRVQIAGWAAPGHQGSTGISVINSLHTASAPLVITAVSGSNSYNKFYSNTIQNCNNAITINGRSTAAIAAPYTFTAGGFGDTGNDIGGTSAATGNTILNFGGATGSTNAATGIWAGDQYDLNISYNTINNNNGAGVNHPSTLRGILLGNPVAPAAPTANATVSYNTITLKGGGTTSQVTGIESSIGASATGFTNTLNFTNNTVNIEYLTATTGVVYGVYHNTSVPTNLNMNSNAVTITSAGSGAINGVWNSTACTNLNMNSNTVSVSGILTSATVNGVYVSAAVTGALNMNNNILGPFNFTNTASNSVGFRGTYISTGASTATINMNNNSISGLNYSGANTGFMSMFGSSGTVLSETVNNNSASNITIPCTGTFRFLDVSNSSSSITISGNSLTNFTNNVASTAAFQLIYNFGSPTGIANLFNNTFTNIVLNRSATGFISSTGVAGIFWGTSASATHNFYNNTIDGMTNNGVGTLSPLSIGYGANASVYNNTIKNISCAGIALGINYGNSSSVNVNVYGNTISSITSTGAATNAYGILVGTSATLGPTGTVNLYGNKICDVSATGATGSAEGIRMFRGATSNIYNNLIGGITAANSTNGTAVAGVNIVATTASDVYRLYYNTIHLLGTGATNFGSSSVSTTTGPTLDLRNNIFSNMTTPTGTGLAVGHRRSSTTLTSFSSSSNNNMWYSGTPSATNLIYYDGTNSDQTLGDYQTRVATRESASFSGDITSNLLSTTCGNATFLHIDPSVPTQLESGATATAISITTDFDGDTRGVIGDVGADEFNGTTPAPLIVLGNISPALTTQCAATARDIYCDVTTLGGTINTVEIIYSFNGVAQTPITMTNVSGDTYYGTIPAAAPSSAVVTWSIKATNTISLVTSLPGTTYYDDILSGLNVSATASVNPVCSGSQTVLTASINYPGGDKILGAGASTSATYSNPFYSLFSNTHNQHLILASELTALGMYAGNISALGLNITAIGTLPMLDFSLKIGSTTATSLTSFVTTPLTQVYTNASYLPVAGVNMMNFTAPFYWDGVSNLVIEICHGNPASTATMSRTCQVDNTTFISSIHTHKTVATAGTAQCSDNTTNLLTYSLRPRFYFTAALATSNFVWNDGASNIGSTASITVNPTSNTTYSCSMDALGCSTSASVSVTTLAVPTQPFATNSTQCGLAIPTASVASNAGVDGTGQYYWYDALTGGNLLQGPPLGNTLATYYTNDFSSATLTNASIAGNASITSGYLQLTPNATSQAGAFTVNAPSTYAPTMLQVEFDETNSPAGNADGFSYSFCDDGSATGTTPTNAEYGTGSKLRISFDTYGAAAGAAGIYILYGTSVINSPGQVAGTNGVVAYSSDVTWVNASNVHVIISVDAAGLCSVTVGGTPIFTNVQLPAGYASANKATWSHFFKARSGGIAGNFILDNVNIQTNAPAAGSTTWLNQVGTTTTWYVSEKAVGGCQTLRTPVTVTVATPPSLTVSNSKTVCNNSIQELTVTSFVPDYTTYSWAPTTNLFIDAACTVPYAGGSTETVYFQSGTTGAYTYTLSASEPINGCQNQATVTMSVLPSSVTVSSNPQDLCLSGNSVVSFTPTSNLYNATIQWASSPTNSGFTPISGANGLTYSATGITSSTYYQVNIIDGDNNVCLSPSTQVVVNNPSISSTTPGTRCGTGTVNLGATASGAGTVKWYANATGGTPLASGTSFTTPSISSSTTYYVSSTEGGGGSQQVGKAGITSAATVVGTYYMNFTVSAPVTIQSVKCYFSTVGTNYVLNIRNASTLVSVYTVSGVTTTNGTVTGQTVPVGATLAPGNYQMGWTTDPGTYRESTGASYPYTIPGVISITGNTFNDVNYYYYFYAWTVTSGCESSRTPVVATVTTAPSILPTGPAQICEGQSATLDVTSPNDPNYEYTWTPGNLTGANQTVTPTVNTTYTVTAYDPNTQCQLFATLPVVVNTNPTLSGITATPSSVNPGCNTAVSLEATTSAPLNLLVGNASSTTVTSTAGITPYNSNWEGSRTQYLILASEMTGLGFSAGNISSLGFDVTALGTGTFAQSGYTVKMGNTTDAAFAGAYLAPPFTTVYGPVTQPLPSLGVNTLTFTTPFNWDGVSNIVIDICHDNDISNTCASCFSSSSTVRYTNTTFNSVYGRYNDNAQACGTNAASVITTFTNRPNMYLNGIAGQPTDKVWMPGSLTGSPVSVTPTATSTYTVTCTNATTGCTTSGSVTVTMNANADLTGLSASYLTTDAAVTMTGTPAGGVFSGPGVTGSTFDPATAGVGTHTITYLPTGYCVPASVTVIVNPAQALVPVKCFLQGFYLGSGTMQPVLNNQGMSNPTTDCDDVTVE
ncbi:MAG: hypothetical protein JNM95_01810, partial [Chitinophagaceae bacterium]|nr:hypothetical protein [Chitinophagaceae bacterium]